MVEGPAFPESGWRAVDGPGCSPASGGGRVVRVDVFKREGSCGSMAMAPSFWRSRILKSRRLICRSSFCQGKPGTKTEKKQDMEKRLIQGRDRDKLTRWAALSLKPTFSSWTICALSKFAKMFLAYVSSLGFG